MADIIETKTPTPAQPAATDDEPAPSASNTRTDEPNPLRPADPADAPGRKSTQSDHTLVPLSEEIQLLNTLDTLNTLITALDSAPSDDPGFDQEFGDLVPTYTETADPSPQDADQQLLILLTSNPSLTTLLALPLTTYPLPLTVLPTWTPALGYTIPPTTTPLNPLATNASLAASQKETLYKTQVHIITTFFTAITTSNTALITAYITQGLVSPDVPSATGLTPLLAAIHPPNPPLVCHLLSLGAQANLPGTAPATNPPHRHRPTVADQLDDWRSSPPPPNSSSNPQRTPLMLAAATGHLALVKLLLHDFAADDSVIAPDGQLALRLAAEAGHRDVVAVLPARRGGAWRRWRTQHAVAVRRVRVAVGRVVWFVQVVGWRVPRFLLWEVPKRGVVLPAVKGARYCWGNRARFGGWCGRQARAFPGRVGRVGRGVWRGVKKVPGGVWRGVKEVPGVVRALVKALWKLVTRIPAVMKRVCVWLWESVKRLGRFAGHVFMRVVATLHTAVAAVLDFFRSIKLRDVWNGVCEVATAVFRGVPYVIWKIIQSAGVLVAGIIILIFGGTGKLIVLLLKALWYVAKYVPEQLAEIIAGIWSSIAKGYHEVMVWINPKH